LLIFGERELPASETRPGLRIAAILLRTVFICLLIAVTLSVSAPQNETVWTVYETPADLVRVLLGIGASVWLVFQLFRAPADESSQRTWIYLGLAAVPCGLLLLFVIWR
jgi:hypothetical protein